MKLLSSIELFDVVDGGTVGLHSRTYIWAGAPLFEAAADDIPWVTDFDDIPRLRLHGVRGGIGHEKSC